MITIQHAVFAAILTSVAISPAFADTCNFTVGGRLALDDESCSTSTRAGTSTIKTDNGAVLVVRRSILFAHLPDDQVRVGYRRTYRMKSYGQIVKSSDTDQKVCYFNSNAVLCIDGGNLFNF